MGDRVKALRRENNDLNRQLNDLMKEFQSIKSKMAEQKDFHEAAAAALLNTQDVQFLSDSYDALVKSESSLSKALESFSRTLDLLTVNVDRIDIAINEMLYYSYQFTRRMTRDTVLASRGNASRLTTKDLDLPSTAENKQVAIYSHLMLRLQELLHSAKANQNTYNYKWCWAKGTAIFLCKTDSSMTIRLRSIDDLTKLRLCEHPKAGPEDPCS